MVDIRDHGGMFGGGRKARLFLPKLPNTGQKLFTSISNPKSKPSISGNYFVFSSNGSKLIRDEYDKNGNLLATINVTTPKSLYDGNIYIKKNSVMVLAIEGTTYYVLKFDKNLNLIQTFTTSSVVTTTGLYRDINENGWVACVTNSSSMIVFDQNGSQIRAFPDSTFSISVNPDWVDDDLLLACTGTSSGTWVLCSVSSGEISPALNVNTDFGTVFKKFVDMSQLITV